MHALRGWSALAAAAALVTAVSCGDASNDPHVTAAPTSCSGVSIVPTGGLANAMSILGIGLDTIRYQAEIAVRGTIAYTTSWNVRRVQGNKVSIWDVSAGCPVLLDSVIVAGAITTGDVAVSDDGSLLVVATEFSGGSIAVYDLADPRRPRLLSRFSNDQTTPGVHTAELGRVNGKLYAFLSIDPNGSSVPARLVTVDLSNPSSPTQVYVKLTGNPYVHDTYQRDGYLFLALWNDGVDIWDIGGGGTGATPAAPRVLGNVKTLGGEVHNIWWYHDPSGAKKFAFVGEEGAGTIGSSSRGDIHVIDVSDFAHPKEVAFYHVDGAGTHNFSVDEVHGILYAAFYNGGVRALDVHGDLGTCAGNQQAFDAINNLLRCDLRLMGREVGVGLTTLNRQIYIWGVQYLNGAVYASDMVNGIWKLGAVR